MATQDVERIEFKAEIRQLLDILVHSLYSEREIFLRELVSNASDALHRVRLEQLRSQEVADPGAELGVWLEPDSVAGTLTVRDSGLGMTQEELVAFLGTIAHSGARGFVEAMKELNKGEPGSSREVIGQFGVGFYSVFMVADEVTVSSRSFRPDAAAAFWRSSGEGSYEVGPAEREARGTSIVLKLKEDAREFLDPERLRQVVRTHSDYIAFPIYLRGEAPGGAEEAAFERINQQTAPWRERPEALDDEARVRFYRQLTLDPQEPLRTIHVTADAPIQFYALLYVPSKRDLRLFRHPEEGGLRLYARKVLIQERFRELLPPYLRFLEGVVDSEDLPLNVSREMVQATPVVTRIRSALTRKVAGSLTELAEEDPERYATFYREFGPFLKEGIAGDPLSHDGFVDLLRFIGSRSEGPDDLVSLRQYVERMADGQQEIYYLLGDDPETIVGSAHLESFRRRGLEVLYLTDPLDGFMMLALGRYDGKPLRSVDAADLELPPLEAEESERQDSAGLADDAFGALAAKVAAVLGERVAEVRPSRLLSEGAARLVAPRGVDSSLDRVQRLMNRETALPKRILELNRNHPLVKTLSARQAEDPDDPLLPLLIEQLFENELLLEGLHPHPAEMVPRLRKLLEAAAGGRRGEE